MMVLDHTDNLSATLQTTNLCAANAQKTAKLVVDTITSMRNEQGVTSFYEMVKIRAEPPFTRRTIFSKKTKSSQ